jgi:hypothetical protein
VKITIDISDSLLRALAAREGVNLRTLVERGLHRVVAETGHGGPFKLRRRTYKDKALRAELAETSWEVLRDLAYETRRVTA